MKLLSFFVAVIFSFGALADDLKTPKSTRLCADQIVDLLAQNKFREGVDLAKPFWPMPEKEIDSLAEQIDQKLAIVANRFGKPLGKEFVARSVIGKSFIRYYYLHKFENHAGYWRIDFYKPKDVWRINSITFMDSVDVLYN